MKNIIIAILLVALALGSEVKWADLADNWEEFCEKYGSLYSFECGVSTFY